MGFHLYDSSVYDLVSLLDLKLHIWQKNRSYLPEYILLGSSEKNLFVSLLYPSESINEYNHYKGVPVLFIENRHSLIKLI